MNGSGLLSRLPLISAILLLFLLAGLMFLPEDGIWVNDEGNRMLSILSFADGNSGFLPDKIPSGCPGLNSYSKPFFIPAGNGFRSAYSPVFPAVCSIFYRMGGFAACRLIVILCGFFCAVLTGLAAKEMNCGPVLQSAAILVCGSCTPVWFYSGVLFEVVPSAMFCALSLLFLLKKEEGKKEMLSLLLAGIFLGTALWLREEVYLICAGIGLAFLLCRTPFRKILFFSAGFLLLLLPLWIINDRESGSILGLHAAVYSAIHPGMPTLLQRLSALYFFVGKPHFEGTAAILCTLAGIIFIPAALFGRRREVRLIATILLLMIAACNTFFLLTDQDPVLHLLSFQSLWGSVPFLTIPLLSGRELWQDADRRKRFLLVSTYAAILLTGLALDIRNTGIFFGPRHFTTLMPFLSLAAVLPLAGSVSRKMHMFSGFFFLFAFAAQIGGITLLADRKNFSAEIVHAAGHEPGMMIASDVFWVPEELAALENSCKVLYIDKKEGLFSVVRLAEKERRNEFRLILSEEFGCIDNPTLIALMQKYDLSVEKMIVWKRMRFLSLKILRARKK